MGRNTEQNVAFLLTFLNADFRNSAEHFGRVVEV